MRRVPEPELMDDSLQVKAYSEADFGVSDQMLMTRLERFLVGHEKKIDSKSLIIDFGCGPGNITERLARRWPSAQVVGIDGSKEMVSVAWERKKHDKSLAKLKGLSYCYSKISSLSEESGFLERSASILVSNSLLHHLKDPYDFWNSLKYFAAPNAVCFHRDLRRPLSIQIAKELQSRYLSNAPEILRRDYLASLLSSFTVEELKSQLNVVGLDHLRVLAVEDRYLEVVGTL